MYLLSVFYAGLHLCLYNFAVRPENYPLKIEILRNNKEDFNV
jgi:hypothetical protein